MVDPERPKLRALDRFLLPSDEEVFVVLKDPRGFAPPMKLERIFEPVLDALDGTKTLAQIRQSLTMVHGLSIAPGELAAFVAQLDADGLLEGPQFDRIRAEAIERFDADDVRATRQAGVLYPASSADLERALHQHLPAPHERTLDESPALALVTPHHELCAAAPVLDEAVRRLPRAEDVDTIILLGTDHAPGMRPFAITEKDYATPLGAVPTEYDLVDALCDDVPELGFESLRHRDAHSLEMTAIVLRHLYGERCPRVVPILCGRATWNSPQWDSHRDALLTAIETRCRGRRILWWAAAELSHIGGAYGTPDDTSGARMLDLARAQDERCARLIRETNLLEVGRVLRRAPPAMRPSGAPTLDVLLHAVANQTCDVHASYRSAPLRSSGEVTELQGWAGLLGARFDRRPA